MSCPGYVRSFPRKGVADVDRGCLRDDIPLVLELLEDRVLGAWVLGSVLARLEIWINSLRAWIEAPVFGHGLGSYEWAYAPWKEWHLTLFPTMGSVLNAPLTAVGMAHSEPIQILAEFGLIGAALSSIALVLAREVAP